ncbi:hypothetical protein FA95DRAFT_1612686 [Auriscalpium vulgare]|uniref:Uncharacterized protein n=1 Tax=Auriscalpium vulgare TaxID=40419 RepID=A0ACB8R6W0_9AGAM|nr:hypothetical protein FA95DRAFT_1612686 [Auriscalpium vulgare]
MNLPMLRDLLNFAESNACAEHVSRVIDDFTEHRDKTYMLASAAKAPQSGLVLILEKNEDGTATVMTPDGAEMIEATLEVQGVLVSYDLPPVTNRKQIGPKPAWAKQSVKIMGFGAPEFQQAVRGFKDVHHRLSSLYKLNALEPHGLDAPDSALELDFSSRYVTPRNQVKGEIAIPFGSIIDPNGILMSTMAGVGSHLEDNQVLYYDCLKDPMTGQPHFVPIDPSILRIGQVVQLQVAFASVPLWGRKGSFRMVAKLRSIAILDRGLQEAFEKDLAEKQGHAEKTHIVGKRLKRKIGYSDVPATAKRAKDTSEAQEGRMEEDQQK